MIPLRLCLFEIRQAKYLLQEHSSLHITHMRQVMGNCASRSLLLAYPKKNCPLLPAKIIILSSVSYQKKDWRAPSPDPSFDMTTTGILRHVFPWHYSYLNCSSVWTLSDKDKTWLLLQISGFLDFGYCQMRNTPCHAISFYSMHKSGLCRVTISTVQDVEGDIRSKTYYIFPTCRLFHL